MTTATAYCVTCKAEQPVKDARRARLVNQRVVEMGTCAACGTRTSKFVREKEGA
jgi:hypothetical protein